MTQAPPKTIPKKAPPKVPAAAQSKPQQGARIPTTFSFKDKITKPGVLAERKILVYGPSGSGKTTFVGSAANDERTAPILALDFEGGGSSLVGIASGLDYARIRDWADYTEAYEYLKYAVHPYKSVAVDSVSETHVYSLLSVIEYEVDNSKEGRRKDEYSDSQGVFERQDITKAEQSDYGRSLVQMRRFLRLFRDLPYNIFFTSLPRMMKAPREGNVQVPALFGQMAEEIIGMFDVTAYLAQAVTKEETSNERARKVLKRTLYLQNAPGIRVKVRTPWAENVPDMINFERSNGVTVLLDAIKYNPKEK